MYSFPPSGGRYWQHQWRDSGQHRDRGYDNGHCGLGGSSTGRWHSAAALARFPPSFCTMHPPALTGRPGPGQAESLYLLWAQQSEWKPSHGWLRPQAWTDFCIFFFFRRQQYGSVLNSVFFFTLQSQFSCSGDGQWGGKLWNKVPHFLVLVWWAKWGQPGTVPSFPWPHFPSWPICRISMWNLRKSKRCVSLSSNPWPGITRPNSLIYHL